ncbi:MAG: serine hydrolase [Pseudonocardiaceae bacterium]|nr:serine hydrolase [Pseudonocardiaceae bacterium]
MEAYRQAQLANYSHREALGPMRPGTGTSGVVVHRRETIATWGDPDQPEMCFSVSKTIISAVAGVAHDRGLLADAHAPVAGSVAHPAFTGAGRQDVTWHHLLQQTSAWEGELWGKPVTAHEVRDDNTGHGTAWAYNDVRVNLLALALTVLCRRSLPDLLRTELLDPIGASATWSWHGYRDSFVTVDGVELPVVSGGAHWGGGFWASANDLALLGQLYLNQGRWRGRQLLSTAWIEAGWAPCPANPDYGYLWWLNDRQRVFPAAPATGRCARGSADGHLLWLDPARELVVASHWTEDIAALLRDVSAAIRETAAP